MLEIDDIGNQNFFALFLDGFINDLALCFLEVLKDLRKLRISEFLVTELGVFPS